MIKNILIISATGNTNMTLAEDIVQMLNKTSCDSKIINLENFNLPLFEASNYEKKKKTYIKEIKTLTGMLINAKGVIICAPEYNGSIPPIITNAIAWISVSTDYWKDGFKNKIGLVCTSSGGPGDKYTMAMQNQLEHLGMKVISKYIKITSSKPLQKKDAMKILENFINVL